MKRRSLEAAVIVIAFATLTGCATMPGGIAPSTEPIDGREYTVLGPVKESDSRINLLGLIPITGKNSTTEAINQAISSKKGDAMINVAIEYDATWWILFTKYSTVVEGKVIRFTPDAAAE